MGAERSVRGVETWTVWRHGGSSFHQWRKLYEGPRDRATVVYENTATQVRRGFLDLRDECGRVHRRKHKPML